MVARALRRKAIAVSGPESDSTEAEILDAAVRVLAVHGFQQATVELTAADADRSPREIYRRWPTRAELFRAAIHRELTAVVDDAFDAAADEESFDALVLSAFSGAVWAVHDHPLMFPERGGDFPLPFATAGSAPVMDAVIASVAGRLCTAAVITDCVLIDAEALADSFVRLAHALLLVPDPARPITSRDDVQCYGRRFLIPLVSSAVVGRSEHGDAARPVSVGADTRPVSLRRTPFQLVPPLVLALLLGSGALATAVVQPWSAPVTPAGVGDATSTPAPASDVPIIMREPSRSGGAFVPSSASVVPSWSPPPSPSAAPQPARAPKVPPPTVDIQHPADATPPGSTSGPRTAPTQRPAPPLPFTPGSRPSAPGTAPQPVRSPGPTPGRPGPGQHPGGGGPGGGPH
jgi:AcrR family transcriptional regulator